MKKIITKFEASGSEIEISLDIEDTSQPFGIGTSDWLAWFSHEQWREIIEHMEWCEERVA